MPERKLQKQLWAVFLLILATAPWGIASATSHIARFVFITEPQNIKNGEISKELIIQAQDASGNPAEAGEAIDLEFTSTSASGEFLNSSGNPVSTVMNKNWKTRTFYYRDSVAGVHNLRVKATGRESKKSWEAAQEITVSSGQPAPPPPAPAPEAVPSPSGKAESAPAGAALSPPVEASSVPAESPPAVETVLPPAGVREEEPVAVVATATAPAMPLIASVQTSASRPPEAPKPVSGPERRREPESLSIASAAAPPSSAAIVSAPRASSNPVFFLIWASALSGVAAIGFLVIKKFFAGQGTY